MADLNKESLEIWNALKPAIDQEIDSRTQGMVQRRKMKVTTAPSLLTNVIGVTEPFGAEMLIPFVTNLISATVGDYVWVEFMYGATNAFASAFASVDDKDYSVAGDLTVGGDATVNGIIDVVQRRCTATIPASSVGWKRILTYSAVSENAAIGSFPFVIDITLFEQARQLHTIRLNGTYTDVFFSDEKSVSQSPSSYNTIDKIRYTYGSNHIGHIDVHYALSSSRPCTAFFDVKCRSVDYNALFVPNGFTAVADAPTGEIIYATYSFAENGNVFSDAAIFNATATFNGNVDGQGIPDFLLGIGNKIASNADCDSFVTEGKYTCPSAAVGSSLTNAPYSSAFGMIVLRVAESQRLVQIAMPNGTAITMKLRYYNGSTWTAWKTLTPA